jgi:hypothetical protein
LGVDPRTSVPKRPSSFLVRNPPVVALGLSDRYHTRNQV